MPIVDVHAHLGADQIFEHEFTADTLLAAQAANGVDATLVQPGAVVDLATVRAQHDTIARLAAERPGRVLGMACPNPRLPEAEYFEEARRCVHDLGFVGLKLHTLAHATSPASAAGRRVFEAARTLGVPLMVHTGTGLPWAAPSLVAPVAREHPEVRVVLAHAGMMVMVAEALAAAELCPNVWLETTWTGGHHVRRFVRALGPERVLFGSDHPDNVVTELTKHRAIGLTERELEWVLGGAAIEVYRLRGRLIDGARRPD
ncbi:MAG: amidohydrolase family protein [Candidatus Rokuibacteriota bacterium]